jgi:DNA adenine methylase
MTFLRWAGSKKQLLTVLASCWHAARNAHATTRYIEGFSGSAALFFHIRPSKALLVDVNSDLQHCLRRVKADPKGVSAILGNLKSTKQEYYRIRAMERPSLTENQRAATFIYLNRNCFNGLYRTNLKGRFNVPFGGARSGALPSHLQLEEASKVLRDAEIVTGDFFETISPNIGKDDFMYLDPPYAKRNVGLDNQYGPDVFGTHDIKRLDKLLKLAHERGAHFLVSYAECEEISDLASNWHTHTVDVRRTIAANTLSRGVARELLITNI